MKVLEIVENPEEPRSIADRVTEIQRELNQVSFGDPTDPENQASGTLAGNAAANHPGNVQNVDGVWFETTLTALRTTATCFHNLDQPFVTAATPNVRWWDFMWSHDGTGLKTPVIHTVNYLGGAVTRDSIVLDFHVSGLAVNAAHPMTVTLFFIRAVR